MSKNCTVSKNPLLGLQVQYCHICQSGVQLAEIVVIVLGDFYRSFDSNAAGMTECILCGQCMK